MSWTNCMEKKIIDKYGEEAATCVEGITKGNLDEIAKCIAGAIGDANPVEIAAELAEWSVECVF